MILKSRKKQGGFTLLELTIVLIIATILTSAIIPQLVNGYTVRAANKTALDISAIGEASRAYYIKYNTWPGVVSGNAVSDLTNGNYLPSSWQVINPFGLSSATPSNFSYNLALNGATPGASLIISTYVPNTNALSQIKNLLPASWVDTTNDIVYSSISVPGIPPNIVPTGAILAWYGTIAPTGFLLCDGTIYPNTAYPNLSSLLGLTFGGDGITTFAVPDLKGRTIVGVNTAANDGSNRVWPTDTNYAGLPIYANVAVIGGVFGEEKHSQVVQELAPHNHTFTAYVVPVHGFSGESTNAPRDNPSSGLTTSTTGGGLGANVVQPSIALTYIIKT